MAQTGYTPIQLYYSTTASAVPTAGNLANGELALNTADMKLYAKNSSGTVTLLASNAATTPISPLTANGVVYVNGSSLPTSGSALTFDGTTLSLTTAGTNALTINTPDYGYFDLKNGTSTLRLQNNNSIPRVTTVGNYPLVFAINESEQMRLTSTGLGIGTSSPTQSLDVNGNVIFRIASSTTNRTLGFTTANGVDGWTIGNGVTASANQFVIYSNTAGAARLLIDSSGNVGIGTSSPTAKIETYKSTAGVWAKFAGVNVSEVSELYIGTDADDANNTVYIATNNTTGGQRFSIRMGGTTSTYDVASFFNGNGFSVGTTAAPGAGAIYATGNITAYYSDKRLKTVSGKIENALDKLGQLSGVYYTNNDTAKSFGYDSDEVQVGVLAQEVEAVLPQIVKAAPFDLDENGNSKSGENYKTVQYERLVPLLIEAVKELRAEVKALKGA